MRRPRAASQRVNPQITGRTDGSLVLRYEDTEHGGAAEAEYDLVVLTVGVLPDTDPAIAEADADASPGCARGRAWHTEGVGLYADQILPRAINLVMRGGEFAGPRARTAAGLGGEVLEIGFGSGLNIPHYPAGIERVRAVDPAAAGRGLAAGRAAVSPVPIEHVGSDAEALPVDDASVDHVLSTWTLCTIPDAKRALGEVRRVLRPGGTFRFVEHGLAPDQSVARLQQLFTPLQRRAFGGCHLDRRIDQLIAAAGLKLTRLDTYYMRGPRALGYTFEGVAVRPE